MLELLTALFNAIFGVSKAVEKGMPNEKIQEEKFEIKKVVYKSTVINKMTDEFFGDLKNHVELKVEDKVNLECPDMNDIQKLLMIKILDERIVKYRKNNAWARPVFKKWLKDNNIK